MSIEMWQPPVIQQERDWLNWPLLLLIALVPLQNLYLGKIPSLGGGFNILNLLMLVALLKASSRRETGYANPMNKYILFLAFCYLLSLGVAASVLQWDERSPFILKDMFFAYLFFFVTYKSLTGMKALKAVFWATVLPLPYMFRVFYANLSWMGFSTYKDKLRLNSGTFMGLGSNEIAAFYATYTFIILGLALVEKEKKRRWFLWACVAMNVYSLLYGFSRGAYLASMVGLVVFCWYNRRIRLLLVAVAVLFALLLSGVDLFPKAVSERFNSAFVEEEELDESAQTRLILWSVAMDKFQSSPLVGVGFGNFKKMNEYGLDTHNYYIKLLAEGGVLSFGAFLLLLIASFRSGLRLLQKGTTPELRKFGICFLAALVSMALGNYFGDRFTHYPLISYFYVYLAMVMKALEWSESEQRSQDLSPAFD